MAWNRPNIKDAESFSRQAKRRSTVLRRVPLSVTIAAVTTAAGLGVASLFIFNSTPTSSSVPVVTSRAPQHRIVETVVPASKSVAVSEPIAPTNASLAKKREIPLKPDGTIDWTKIKPSELPPEVVGSDQPTTEPVRQVFGNSADQVIAMVIATPPDQDLPPIVGLGDDLDVQFFKSLEKPIEINDDDSPEIKVLKENLIATKKEILKMVDSGMTVTEILREHQETFNQNRKDFAENQAIVDQLLEEGDVEGARAYVEKANPVLEKFGAPLLQMPKTREERIAEKRARREARLRAEQQGE